MAPEGLDLPLIAVVGPTASGKTRLALDLARRLGGEILSADMGQLYRHLDAGTAKPKGEWKGGLFLAEGIPYHMVDVLEPSQDTHAGLFAAMAARALEDIRRRGRTAIVAGGTGLYVRALLEGLDPMPPRDPEIRRRLAARAEKDGRAWLHSELLRKDPEAAGRIPPGNIQRLVRALEVIELTQKPISSLWSGPRHRAEVLYLGIARTREDLRSRIHSRARAMFPAMVREVSALVPSRYTGSEPGFRCLGYPEALACARGELSQEEGLRRLAGKTEAYAKRQLTWFNRQTSVRWLKPDAPLDEIWSR